MSFNDSYQINNPKFNYYLIYKNSVDKPDAVIVRGVWLVC